MLARDTRVVVARLVTSDARTRALLAPRMGCAGVVVDARPDDVTGLPYLVLVDGTEHARWFRESELEEIAS